MEHPWVNGTINYHNVRRHMTKEAAISIHGKTVKIAFFRTVGQGNQTSMERLRSHDHDDQVRIR